MSEQKDDGIEITFSLDVETSHDVPDGMKDKIRIVDGECSECGSEMRSCWDHEPGDRYCPECGVYVSESGSSNSVFGP